MARENKAGIEKKAQAEAIKKKTLSKQQKEICKRTEAAEREKLRSSSSRIHFWRGGGGSGVWIILCVMYGDIVVDVSAVLKSLYLLAIFVILHSINS